MAVHSFTPQLQGRPPRPWEIGVLYAHDRRYSDPLIEVLEEKSPYTVGKNQPYNGALEGDTMDAIGLQHDRLHALLEIRNDLIADEAGQNKWRHTLLLLRRQCGSSSQ